MINISCLQGENAREGLILDEDAGEDAGVDEGEDAGEDDGE